jgi:hypothetical protein
MGRFDKLNVRGVKLALRLRRELSRTLVEGSKTCPETSA